MMRRFRVVWGVFVVVLVVGAAVAVAETRGGFGRSAVPVLQRHDDARGDAGGERAGAEEGQNEQNLTADRLDAFNHAKSNGTFTGRFVATTNPASGWVGSRLLNPATDDWEPAVATDPNAPYAYLLTTRYGQPSRC